MSSTEPSPAERQLLDVYQAAEQHLLRAATMQYRSVVRGPEETEAARRAAGARTVAAVAEQVVGFLDDAIPGLLGEILVAAAQRGEAEAVRQLQAARGDQVDAYTARGTNLGALDRLAVGLLARAAEAHNAILRVVPDRFREALAQVLPGALVGVDRRLDASQRAWWDLTQRGITRFQDQAGRNWRLSSYVEMAARTGVARAQLDAQHDRLASLGHDLVIVNGSGDRCPRCRPWHGKILTTTGAGRRELQVEHATRDGVMVTVQVAGSVDDARRDGWNHPQCRCSTSVYLPGVTTVPPLARDNGQYDARQRQRGIERQIRAAKERQASALSPAAAALAARQVRAGQARMRDHLAANPDLLRRSYREQPGAGNIPRRPPSSPNGPQPTNGPRGSRPVDPAGREQRAAQQWEAEKQRVAAQERADRDRQEQTRRTEQERLERERAEQTARDLTARQARERAEQERLDRERQDREQAARELAERQAREAQDRADGRLSPADIAQLTEDYARRIDASPAARRAARRYTDEEFYQVNGALRGRAGERMTADRQTMVDELDQLMGRYETPRPLVVNRRVGRDAIPAGIGPGDTFSDDAFSSTSMRPRGASAFRDKPVSIDIDVPKGSNAVVPDGLRAGEVGEQELLLPRGTQYQVTSIEERDGVTHYRVTAIPPKRDRAEKTQPVEWAADRGTTAQRTATHDRIAEDYQRRAQLDERDLRYVDAYTGTRGYDGYINGADSSTVNSQLRGASWAQGKKAATEASAALDDAVLKWRAPEDLTVWRSTGKWDPPADLKPGSVIEDPAWQSTTFNAEMSFGKSKDRKPPRLEITVPKGTPGIMTNGARPGGLTAPEQELILPRGTRYVVEAVEVRDGAKWVKVTALPPRHLEVAARRTDRDDAADRRKAEQQETRRREQEQRAAAEKAEKERRDAEKAAEKAAEVAARKAAAEREAAEKAAARRAAEQRDAQEKAERDARRAEERRQADAERAEKARRKEKERQEKERQEKAARQERDRVEREATQTQEKAERAAAAQRKTEAARPAGKPALPRTSEERIKATAAAAEKAIDDVLADTLKAIGKPGKSPKRLPAKDKDKLFFALRDKATPQVKRKIDAIVADRYPNVPPADRDQLSQAVVRALIARTDKDSDGRGLRLAVRALDRRAAVQDADHRAVVAQARDAIGDPADFALPSGRGRDEDGRVLLDVDPRDGGPSEAVLAKLEAVRTAGASISARADDLVAAGKSRPDALRAALAEVREMGPAGDTRLDFAYEQLIDPAARTRLEPMVEAAQSSYPREWIRRNRAKRPAVGIAARGRQPSAYSVEGHSINFRLADDARKSLRDIAVHELGHSMETTNEHLMRAERAYLRTRTSRGEVGSRTFDAPTSAGPGGQGLLADDFRDRYAGTVYTDNPQHPHEILTTGVEHMLGPDSNKTVDADHEQFVLGLLAAM